MPEGFLSFQRSFSILLYQSFSDVIFEVKLLHQSSNNSVSSNISLLIRSAFFFVSSSGWKPAQVFAADGMAELLADKVNALSAEQFQQWLAFHWAMCEKPAMLGASNHVVFRLDKV